MAAIVKRLLTMSIPREEYQCYTALECSVQRMPGVKESGANHAARFHHASLVPCPSSDGCGGFVQANIRHAGPVSENETEQRSRVYFCVMKAQQIERVIARAIEKTLGSSKLIDPRRPLEKYPQRMTIAQVAAFLNCSENHVRNLCDQGKLITTNIALAGTRETLRITRDSVAQFDKQS
jgi:hypothetical protein